MLLETLCEVRLPTTSFGLSHASLRKFSTTTRSVKQKTAETAFGDVLLAAIVLLVCSTSRLTLCALSLINHHPRDDDGHHNLHPLQYGAHQSVLKSNPWRS